MRPSRSSPSSPLVCSEKFMSCKTRSYGSSASSASARRGSSQLCGAMPDCLSSRASDTTIKGAYLLALQLCEAVEAASIVHAGLQIPVTVSIGVYGGTLQSGDHWDMLISAADRALYEAKNRGRNRVEVGEVLRRPTSQNLLRQAARPFSRHAMHPGPWSEYAKFDGSPRTLEPAMNARSAQFAGMDFVGVPLKDDLTLDLPAMLAAIAQHKPALVYLSYPNNPTGNLFSADDIVAIIQALGDTGLAVVDEAYEPFAQQSFMSRLPEFDNLVVMRTVSKLGLAGIRLGYMSAAPALLEQFDKVRPPYNVNVLTQVAAEFALDNIDVLNKQAAILREQRALLAEALAAVPGAGQKCG
eukprot:gene23808-30079_t